MTQKIIYPNEDGGVTVVHPSSNFLLEHTMGDLALATVPVEVEYRIIDESKIPLDLEFRDSWEYKDGKIVENLGKARLIAKERLRGKRKPLLTALDVQYQRAQEDGRDTTIIISEKQRLRDVTKLADTATTLDELKALSA